MASRIILASPRPAQLSVNTHSLAGVRARYVQPWEDSNLGGGVFILNATIERVEKHADGITVHTRRSDNGEPFAAEVDEVIAATGFQCPLRDLTDLGVTVFGQSRLPTMTNFYESATVPGIFFAGTIGQGVAGLKKYGIPANSGAVHGARYNARLMVQHVAETRFGVVRPRPAVKAADAIDFLLTEATTAPELWNQKSYLARAISRTGSTLHDEGIVSLADFVDARARRGRDHGGDGRHGRHPSRGLRPAARPRGQRRAARQQPAARLPHGRAPQGAAGTHPGRHPRMTQRPQMQLISGLPVALEIGPKRRVFAQAVGWPGWCRAARDEARATDALVRYADRYRAAVGSLGAPLGSGPPVPTIVERVSGTATTDFGAPDAILASDRRLLEAASRSGWWPSWMRAGQRSMRRSPVSRRRHAASSRSRADRPIGCACTLPAPARLPRLAGQAAAVVERGSRRGAGAAAAPDHARHDRGAAARRAVRDRAAPGALRRAARMLARPGPRLGAGGPAGRERRQTGAGAGTDEDRHRRAPGKTTPPSVRRVAVPRDRA